MSKKHYELIARSLADAKPRDDSYKADYWLAQWRHDVNTIADALTNDNPRFDRSKFYHACGLEQ